MIVIERLRLKDVVKDYNADDDGNAIDREMKIMAMIKEDHDNDEGRI